MPDINPHIEEGWKMILWEEFQSPYFKELKAFLVEETASRTIYPPGKLIFNAFQHTPFNNVKVVILGQDPYHGAGQAHGLCFSVPPPRQATPLPGQYLQGGAFRSRDCCSISRKPGGLGQPGCTVAECHADSKGRRGRITPKPRVGNIYRCGDR